MQTVPANVPDLNSRGSATPSEEILPGVRRAIVRTYLGCGLGTTALGVLWLLSALGLLPRVNWLWLIALLATGIVPVIVAGLNKFSFAFCLTMCAWAVVSLLEQTGVMRMKVAFPTVVICAGAAMTLSLFLSLRWPAWMGARPESRAGRTHERQS
jgi:hypothetical protein